MPDFEPYLWLVQLPFAWLRLSTISNSRHESFSDVFFWKQSYRAAPFEYSTDFLQSSLKMYIIAVFKSYISTEHAYFMKAK